jgi:transposase-like protein
MTLDRCAAIWHKNKMATSPRPYRWKYDRPPSLQEFMAEFPDDAACAERLAKRRWPDGFACPSCDCRKGWKLETRSWLWECAKCGKQTSVTAGTILHGTHLPLRTWFLAVYLVATHSNGISALQLQSKLGIGSYKSAWLLLHKLRKAMVDPERTPLAGIVEADESSIPFLVKTDPVCGGQGRSHDGKILIAGAVECTEDGKSRRIRLSRIVSYTAVSLKEFIEKATATGSTIITDGFSSYPGIMEGRKHVPKVVGAMAAHMVLPWIHKVFTNLKRLGLGVYHGFREKHIQAYLDEFTFRWNRKRSFETAWINLLGICLRIPPMTYWTLTGRSSPKRTSPVAA